MNELEQLKKIVLEGGFDEDSKKEIAVLENEMRQSLIAEKLQQHTVIQNIISYLKQGIEQCTVLLSSDPSLSDLERRLLFSKREMHEHLLSLFQPPAPEVTTQKIKDLLNVAKAQSGI